MPNEPHFVSRHCCRFKVVRAPRQAGCCYSQAVADGQLVPRSLIMGFHTYRRTPLA